MVVETHAALEADAAAGAHAKRGVRQKFGPRVHVIAANRALHHFDLHVRHELQFGGKSAFAGLAFELWGGFGRVGDSGGSV